MVTGLGNGRSLGSPFAAAGPGASRARVYGSGAASSAQAWLHHAGRVGAAHEFALIVAAVVAAAAAAAVVWVRMRRGAMILARRLRVVVVPTESFDPSMEALLRFANMLAQARTPLPLLTPRHCQAIWFRLLEKRGDLAFVLETAQWRASAVRSALPAEAELYPVEELEPAKKASPTPPPASPRGEVDNQLQAGGEDGPAPGPAAAAEGLDMAEEGEDLVVIRW